MEALEKQQVCVASWALGNGAASGWAHRICAPLGIMPLSCCTMGSDLSSIRPLHDVSKHGKSASADASASMVTGDNGVGRACVGVP